MCGWATAEGTLIQGGQANASLEAKKERNIFLVITPQCSLLTFCEAVLIVRLRYGVMHLFIFHISYIHQDHRQIAVLLK